MISYRIAAALKIVVAVCLGLLGGALAFVIWIELARMGN